MAEGDIRFVSTTVLKRDAFSETFSGHDEAMPERKLVLRRLSGLPVWSRWFAWILARREIRGLKAVQGIEGVPDLLRVDRDGILRGWSEGTPLNIARPDDLAWYADARRLLRALRARKITHNDLAKPQNWLMRPDGGAGVIDFQLTWVHRRRNWLYRVMAYETCAICRNSVGGTRRTAWAPRRGVFASAVRSGAAVAGHRKAGLCVRHAQGLQLVRWRGHGTGSPA